MFKIVFILFIFWILFLDHHMDFGIMLTVGCADILISVFGKLKISVCTFEIQMLS